MLVEVYRVSLRRLEWQLRERVAESAEDPESEGDSVTYPTQAAPTLPKVRLVDVLRPVLRWTAWLAPAVTVLGLIGLVVRNVGDESAGVPRDASAAPAEKAREVDAPVRAVEAPPPELLLLDTCPEGTLPGSITLAGQTLVTCDSSQGTMVTVPGVAGTSRVPFLVDRVEVPVSRYRACVADEGCTPIDEATCDASDRSAWDSVGCVTGEQAVAFCAWAGKELCAADQYAALERPASVPDEAWPSVTLNAVGNRGEWTSDGTLRPDPGFDGVPTASERGLRCCVAD